MGGATVIVEHSDPSVQFPSGNWQPLTKSAVMTLQTGAVMTVKFTGMFFDHLCAVSGPNISVSRY